MALHLADAEPRSPRQFSLRSLFTLTLAVSLILTIGVLCRGSRYFGAFSSPWALTALAPIAAVWAAHSWRLVSPRKLAFAAGGLYVISLAVPAIGLDDDIAYGWIAAYWSLAFGYEWIKDIFIDQPRGIVDIFGHDPPWRTILFPIGAAVNIAFVGAYLAFLLSGKRPMLLTIARRTAIAATSLALLDILLIAISGDLSAVYLGYGLWVASSLALALGSRR